MINHIVLIVSFLFTLQATAGVPQPDLIDTFIESPSTVISEQVQDRYPFFGLATYLNAVQFYLVDTEGVTSLDDKDTIRLQNQQWLAIAGRFNVLLVQAPDLSVTINKTNLEIGNTDALSRTGAVLQIAGKDTLSAIAPELDRIRYVHLWRPLAVLANWVESALVLTHTHIIANWGLAIVVVSLLIRILLLPVTIMTERYQHRVSEIQAKLAPVLDDIKARYDGEQAHERMMAAHRDLGVSPFYTLKPMLATMIQIPVLIAVFNALGEMPQLSGQSVLWVNDLAYPDVIATLPLNIPMLGDTLHALPFVMTFVSIAATLAFS
jgi:YidC/Oxa1 family membrane protein insertase